ncbi:MAG: hypothetical protein P8179_04485 [Candidatus Thiodiazotropha sp.]
MKSALVVVLGKGCSCTSMCPRHGCIHARRAIAGKIIQTPTQNSPYIKT